MPFHNTQSIENQAEHILSEEIPTHSEEVQRESRLLKVNILIGLANLIGLAYIAWTLLAK